MADEANLFFRKHFLNVVKITGDYKSNLFYYDSIHHITVISAALWVCGMQSWDHQ